MNMVVMSFTLESDTLNSRNPLQQLLEPSFFILLLTETTPLALVM